MYRPQVIQTELGPDFYDEVEPAKFRKHTLRYRNERALQAIGLEALDDRAFVDHFAAFEPLPGNLTKPLALRYHGHQFQQYNSRLGDGRGFLFAQMVDDRDRLVDLTTKGSGQTPWSRGGDGRLTLKGGVREVLAAEMLEALGVTTSRALSVVETGEALQRNDEPSPTRSCVLVRVVWSSVRLGTFQRVAFHDDGDNFRKLVDFTLRHWFPNLATPEQLFAAIVRNCARLVGQWLAAGFVHGVLNSDNLNVTGESFDYGPWRFLPRYDPSFVAAYFDQNGLYAYGRQPAAVRWNLAQLTESFTLVANRSKLEHALVDFEVRVLQSFTSRFLWRMNVETKDPVSDSLLAQQILCSLKERNEPWDRGLAEWPGNERASLRPRFAELVSMHVDEVERIWAAISEHDDWAPFHAHIAAVRRLGAHLGRPT